jgi:redox-sensitive bicupin YhaK (pirin superfamily)
VPGFPAHPHRGFETVTIVRKGLIDHSDSLGATARFGRGDVQWVTAGRGLVHSEMFPLLATGEDNPLELFQIWLNLPRRSKMAEPHFTMLWNAQIPRAVLADAQGRKTEVAVIAGRFGDVAPLPAPPDSWAAQADAEVAIWTLRMEPGAGFQLPPATLADTRRTLYFFKGGSAMVGDRNVEGPAAITLDSGVEVGLLAGDTACEFLLLQGRPIGEPVAQYGPFVMNDQEGIEQAFSDYRATGFGGWPWPVDDPVHSRDAGRFARDPEGLLITPTESVAH